jgi:hypothetical protein
MGWVVPQLLHYWIQRAQWKYPRCLKGECLSVEVETRGILLRVGRFVIRARSMETMLAKQLWQALPIYGVAEIGACAVSVALTPPALSLGPGAQIMARGQVGYLADRACVVIAWGNTRLPGVQVWAEALDDVSGLAAASAGMRVALLQADS